MLNLRNIVKIVLIVGVMLFFKFDFTYNLMPYRIRSNDTVWNILDSKVFHNSAITGLSIEYLKGTNPTTNFDYIQAHKPTGNGYTLSVFLGKISIQAPNNQYIVKNVALLPESALWNHFLQVLVHDIVILAFVGYIYAVFQENIFRITPDLIAYLVVIPVLLAILVPFGVLILAWVIRALNMVAFPQNLEIFKNY